ncbi:hypothetical protein [Agrobacterium tumefaciens]|uniref:Uncharacterized protein n=1 Tax=Agrobacterium tumefaciens TaxID=358 RepID=A0A176X8Y7_AGRTU|nr:hypothetical protein [Agrobacterium tumefaciens]OAE43584.1 hypothetical protein A7J57_04780 [Agrobacterium tumefaciens]
MIENLPLVGTVFEEIEILPASITGIFRDHESDALGILPFFAPPTLYLVELSFDGGERQGLWMGDDPDKARQCAREWAEKLRVRIVDRSDRRGFH